MIEFLISIPIIVATLTSAGWMIRTEWTRTQCAYLVFETTHARLTGGAHPRSRYVIDLWEDENSVTGEGRCGSAKEKITLPKLDTDGVLHLPLGAALCLIMIFSFGALGMLHRWRSLADLQLKLDRCVGHASLELKSTLNSLESSNSLIRKTRLTLAAATVIAPQARSALELLLKAEAAYQDLKISQWQIRRVRWTVQRGCEGIGELPSFLPGLGVARDPPDVIGLQPLRFEEWEYRIALRHSPRNAAAKVATQTEGEIQSETTHRWRAQWTNFY